MGTEFELLDRLTRDLRHAARLLGRKEVRFLVDIYYQIQDFRIAAAARGRSADESREPNRVIYWVFDSMRKLENNVKAAMGEFASEYTVGKWLQSVYGIGPVISAGLIATLEMEPWKCAQNTKPGAACHPGLPHGPECRRHRMVTAGHFWRFAGLDPTLKWEKKTKRPWNAFLKTLAVVKLGESFVKVQSRDGDFYGHFFRSFRDTGSFG